MSILILGVGGGGGNILRSLKAMFRRDLAIAQKSDAKYADRLRRAVTTCFLDTNAFSLSDVPREERLVIGPHTTGQLGARHNPAVARDALDESRAEVEALIAAHSMAIVIGTGGKGTGAGTMFPIAQMAREQRKLVIPIFVRPSFERHEVDKRRFDHALNVISQFDAARIRLIEILNDQGYEDSSPQPQSVVWERMNEPIARGLRGLIYVLSDLSQVDPSDLSALFAGHGRLRIGFAEIDPPPSEEPTQAQVDAAVAECWENRYCAFTRPVGTALVCIQGNWSNIVDARIKGGLASLASGPRAEDRYTPLFARAANTPKPWGVTAVFAEYTGEHAPLAIDWTVDRRLPPLPRSRAAARDANAVIDEVEPAGTPIGLASVAPIVEPADHPPASFSTLWEFALAVNRGNAAALALAGDGIDSTLPIDGAEVRKLLGTVWFRSVLPQLSPLWRERILDALVTSAPLPNHLVKVDRRQLRLSELDQDQLKTLSAKTNLAEQLRGEVDLLLTVTRFWGPEALGRFHFASPDDGERSRLANMLLALRR